MQAGLPVECLLCLSHFKHMCHSLVHFCKVARVKFFTSLSGGILFVASGDRERRKDREMRRM